MRQNGGWLEATAHALAEGRAVERWDIISVLVQLLEVILSLYSTVDFLFDLDFAFDQYPQPTPVDNN